jgi:arsenate reductase
MNSLLIICTGNSCRSQMAHGFLNSISKNLDVFSAGTKPEPVNKYAIKVMSQIGIDISLYNSNNVNEYSSMSFDYIITVCDKAKVLCPVFSNSHQFIHKSFLDPADAKGTEDEIILQYIEVRDQLTNFLKDFLQEKFSN